MERPRRAARAASRRAAKAPCARHGRSEQRMGESEALAVRLDDARREGLGQSGLVTVPDDGLHEGHRRIGKRGNGGGDVESLGSKRVETHVQSWSRAVGMGSPRRRRACRLGVEGGSELEREERITPRRLPELDQHRPRERRVEAVAQQLVRRAKAQARGHGPFVVGSRRPRGSPTPEPRRVPRARRHTLVVAAARPHTESPRARPRPATGRRRRRGRGCARRRATAAPRGRRRPPNVVGAERGVAEQQCGLQGLSLDRRQLGQDVADHLAEHVCQRQERETGLGLRGARRQDMKSAGGCQVDCREPQRRLADPGLPGDHGDRRQLIRRVEKIEE